MICGAHQLGPATIAKTDDGDFHIRQRSEVREHESEKAQYFLDPVFDLLLAFPIDRSQRRVETDFRQHVEEITLTDRRNLKAIGAVEPHR